MKNITLKIPLVLFVLNLLYAELPQSSTCGMPTNIQAPAAFTNVGGRYITSMGRIKSFILFVRFSDDEEETESWPNASTLPMWAQNLLNPTYSKDGEYTTNSFTNYIYENSYGKLHIYGDVYFVTLPNTESYYYQYSTNANMCREKIQVDAFDELALIPGLDLSEYDNWRNLDDSEEFSPDNTGDSIVDMCWVIMRNLHDDVYSSVHLGIDIALLYSSKTINGITIQSGFPGSGISMFMSNFIDQTPRQTTIYSVVSEMDNDGSHFTIIGTMVHELSHYFFGVGHFGAIGIGAKFSLLNRSSSGMGPYACNSGGLVGTLMGYEKIRLGWISNSEIKTVTSNGTFSLKDLSSTTNGYKIIKIPLDASQSIFLENRSWNSSYEARKIPENFGSPLNPGILAYLIPFEDDYLSNTTIQQICSDGKWDWIRLVGSGIEGPNDIIAKSIPNSFSGYDEKEKIYIPSHPSGNWLAVYYPNGYGSRYGRWYKGDTYLDEYHNTGDYSGDGKDLFSTGEVISKWSNGASHKQTSYLTNTFTATEVGIEIKNFDGEEMSYTIEVRTSQPVLLAPSKPQSIAIEVYQNDGNNYPKLTWTAAGEPDVSTGGYVVIERREKDTRIQNSNWSSWSTIATISGSSNSYIDETITTAGSGQVNLQYRFRFLDSQSKYSVYSDVVGINASPYIEKRGSEDKKPKNYEITQNYPNPFNPSTTINYSIPEPTNVRITVFDHIGREVACVVNTFHNAGNYSATFDASKLASGLYFYKITAGRFAETKRMLLLK